MNERLLESKELYFKERKLIAFIYPETLNQKKNAEKMYVASKAFNHSDERRSNLILSSFF